MYLGVAVKTAVLGSGIEPVAALAVAATPDPAHHPLGNRLHDFLTAVVVTAATRDAVGEKDHQ
jgi:hypothetical protein